MLDENEILNLNLGSTKTYGELYYNEADAIGVVSSCSVEKVFFTRFVGDHYGLLIDVNEQNIKYYKDEELDICYRYLNYLYYLRKFKKKFIIILDKEALGYYWIDYTVAEICRYLKIEASFETVKELLSINKSEINYPFIVNIETLTFEEKEDLQLLADFFIIVIPNQNNINKGWKKLKKEEKENI